MGYLNGKVMMVKLRLLFHILITLIGFTSTILHIIYSPDPLVSTTKFTIHSNLIVSMTFFFSSIEIISGKTNIPFLGFLKNCSIIYMSVNILTYHFILSSGEEYSGIRIVTNFTLHYLIPILIIINWIVFESKKKYSFKYIFVWMFYPALYTSVSSLRGLFDGFYPYFFLNPNGEIPVGVGSYWNVALFIAAFLFVFIILGLLLITLNRLFLRVNKYTSSSKHDVSKTNMH